MVFEIGDRCEATLQESFMHRIKFVIAFGKLAGTDGDEVSCIEGLRNVRDHKHGFSYIKWKQGLNAMCHVVRGVTCGLLGRDTIGPEDVMHESGPLGDVAIAGFDERVMDCVVRAFNDAIFLGVVCRDTNVTDMVCLCKPVKGGDEWCSVVGDDFFKSSPLAEDLFKDEGAKGATCFGAKHPEFWPC